MSWQNRYRSSAPATPLLPGGKWVLGAIFALAAAVIGYEISKNLF
jgi:hypothetical protein